jgi:hypothetical protein
MEQGVHNACGSPLHAKGLLCITASQPTATAHAAPPSRARRHGQAGPGPAQAKCPPRSAPAAPGNMPDSPGRRPMPAQVSAPGGKTLAVMQPLSATSPPIEGRQATAHRSKVPSLQPLGVDRRPSYPARRARVTARAGARHGRIACPPSGTSLRDSGSHCVERHSRLARQRCIPREEPAAPDPAS